MSASARMASSSRKTGSKKKRLTLRGSQARRSSQSGGEEERGVERAASSRVRTEDNRTTTQPQPQTDLVGDGGKLFIFTVTSVLALPIALCYLQ